MSETPLKTLGKYQIKQELGKGAMGVVYLGFDPALEREVALKVMASAIVSDNDLKERFEREAKSVARLQHPNIVTVYDLGYDAQGAPFIAMEYLKGQDLEHRIRKDPLTLREKLDVVAQTSRGLAHAHKAGIVHRDIKPANIFITDNGEAKIMDFGVARWQQSSHTQTGAVLGTADYMSPEQIRGQKVDGRSDIFSVGVILYRLLTNKKPFAGENIQAVFFKVLNQEPPDIVLPDGTEMPELHAIVAKALSKNSDQRYASADDLAEDIRDLMGLYRDLLNEDTVFETMFDPAGTVEAEPGSDAGKRKTSSTGRVLGATTPGGGSRTHRPGTAYPPTAASKAGAGRTASASRTAAARTAIAPTKMMSRTQVATAGPGPVGIPIEEPSGAWKYAAAAALVLAVGGGVYWFTQERNPPDVTAGTNTNVVTPTPPAAPTTEERLQTVRNALDRGFLNAASNEVEQILMSEPDNAAALALKAEIEEAQRRGSPGQVQTVQATTSVPTAVPKGPSRSEQASKLAVEASVAMGNGKFDEADALIQQGRGLDPGAPVWQQLSQQVARARQDSAHADALSKRQALIDGYVRQAAEHVKNRNYEEAIAAYDKALEQDPTNVQLLTGRNNVVVALDQQKAAASVRALQISETATEYVSPSSGSDGPGGFETGGVKVKRATRAPENPGELVLQIQPETVQPGDPFTLRVRVHNQGNKPIGVRSIELVSTYGSKTTGRGQQLTPLVQRVNPRDTSVIWETRGTWTEDQNQGSIEAIVTLIGDAKLRKTIRWQ
jgi:predicted Ser/Thr protein kinase/tetratricopeptide (TPR) repeat protein